MSRNAQIEEVEDDPEEFDITEYDPKRNVASPPFPDPFDIAAHFHTHGDLQTHYINESESAAFKGYQIVYPIYFEVTRSREEGRRVNKNYAVENPLAREIVDCCKFNRLETIFEPSKCHPKDWANPGRVRVLLKKDGVPQNSKIKNKRQLMQIIGSYLKANPSNERTPLKVRLPQIPHQDKPAPPPAVPRGWKLNTILPLHSPALTGGGVSDNILKDMMAEMGNAGGMPGGMPNLGALQNMFGGGAGEASSAGESKKREKKKGKK